MIPWDKRDFKKLFPALSNELEQSETGLEDASEGAVEEPLRGFMPGPEDYLMRCATEEEAIQVIEFLKQRREISDEESERLKKQVYERGVRSFGPLREEGYYLRTYHRRRHNRASSNGMGRE
ncbi:MAG: DUF2095 family protein [Nitrososphaerota archaeon]